MEEQSRGEPGSRGMKEEGGMRKCGFVSVQAGTGAGCVCVGTPGTWQGFHIYEELHT